MWGVGFPTIYVKPTKSIPFTQKGIQFNGSFFIYIQNRTERSNAGIGLNKI